MTRPDYIARGGDLVMSPALELQSTTMYSFVVPADLAALTRICDQQLNAVTGGSVIYKPLLPMVSIVCADVAKSYSTTPPDSEKGWMSERDFGIWIPVVAGKMEHGIWKPGRISWYLPYVFVDNVAAMVTGREVYGFFKQTAELTMPASPSSSDPFGIDALVIEKFSPSSEAQVARLMTLTTAEASAAPEPPSGPWGDARQALEAVLPALQQLHAGAQNAAISDWDLLKNLLEDLLTLDVPLVFLKQFRDAGEPAKACYQAVIEAPAHLQRWYGGWFTHPHDVAITPCDSHPIVAECGLSGPQLRANLGFWCKMDFVMQPGRVVAERT
ncbi:MAG: hypothetical protein ACTHU0_18900 [Kofleriaceae bacterium]